MSTPKETKNPWTTIAWSLIAAFSICWWAIAGLCSLWRSVLLVALSLAAFMVGCLVGFLFTSYGEESGTVGKVRDWLIGGITGLTIAKAGAIKALLLTFAAGPGPKEYALTVSCAVVYTALGFFFMFFQRELILNVVLAQSRAERGRIDGTGHAGVVIQLAIQAFPPSILSGVEDVDHLLSFRKREADKLRALLYSGDVQTFLDDCEEAARSGVALDWDVVSKVANLQYYRTYFGKEEDKPGQAEIASTWIMRALTMNPLHVDLTIKYADVLAIMERYDETVAILERLEGTSEAPVYVKQWLGYWLLFVHKEDEAIHYSEEYHRLFPDESDSIFNVAAAYAQKYCRERSAGKVQDLSSETRRLALTKLKEALRGSPEFAETVKNKWTQEGESFDCLVHDKEFRALVGLPEEVPATAG